MGQVFCILIPIVMMTFVLPKVYADNRFSKYRKWTFWCIFLTYSLGNLCFTLLTRQPGTEFFTEFTPFRSYARLYEPFYEGVNYPSSFVKAFLYNVPPFASIILNILLYYLLGYLLPILFPKLKPKHVILIGCLCSIATEATQYLLKMGWCETDDVIHNTLGTAIGVWVWHLQSNRLNKPKSNELPKE